MNKLEKNYLNIPIIETERLILNYPVETDFKILEVFLKSERSKFVGGPYRSFSAWNDYMANIGHWSLYGHGLWSLRIKDNNEYIGRVGIIKPAMFKEPDLAWQVFKDYEGMGYAYEAAIAVKDYAIHNFNFSSLASHIVEGNKNSISLAERVGYKIKKEEVIDKKKFIIYFHI